MNQATLPLPPTFKAGDQIRWAEGVRANPAQYKEVRNWYGDGPFVVMHVRNVVDSFHCKHPLEKPNSSNETANGDCQCAPRYVKSVGHAQFVAINTPTAYEYLLNDMPVSEFSGAWFEIVH